MIFLNFIKTLLHYFLSYFLLFKVTTQNSQPIFSLLPIHFHIIHLHFHFFILFSCLYWLNYSGCLPQILPCFPSGSEWKTLVNLTCVLTLNYPPFYPSFQSTPLYQSCGGSLQEKMNSPHSSCLQRGKSVSEWLPQQLVSLHPHFYDQQEEIPEVSNLQNLNTVEYQIYTSTL